MEEKYEPGKALVDKPIEKDCDFLQEAFELITSNGNVGYFRIARTGEVLEMNPAMLEIIGITKNSPKSQIRKETINTLLEAVQFGETKNCIEKEIPANHSNKVHALVSIKSIVSENKEIIIGFAEDISANKAVQEKLDISRANLNILIENIDNPTWSLDNNGHLMAFNSVFRKYFSLNFGTIVEIGLPIFEVTENVDLQKLKALFDKALSGEKISKEIKVKLDGTLHYQNVVINPILDKEDKVIGTAFIIHDITELKTTEKLLFKSKTHLHALIDNIPSLVWLKDVNGRFIIANQAFLDFFKIDEITLCSDNINIQPEHKEFWEFITDESEIVHSGAKMLEEKAFVIYKENRWFEIHKTPIYAGVLELVGTTGMARDITNRKIIENILLESEERFRQFAENTSDAFILCSNEAVLYVNPAFQKIYGRSLDEVYQFVHIPPEWVHPDDAQMVINYFRSDDYKNTGKFNGQYRVIKSDGTVTWIWERSFPVTNAEGNIVRYISVASDITRQKQLEVDLLKTQTQQQAILDNVPHHAWLKDIQGRYVSVNEAFAKFYNQSKEEFGGKTDSDFCHPDLAELYAYNDYLVLKTKKQQQFDEFIDTPEGTVYTETIKTPVINNEGDVIGITGISRDITYYKRIEQQLRANDDRLKALLQNSTDAITVINKDGIVIFDSSFAINIDDFASSKDSIGHMFLDYVIEADKGIVKNAIEKVIQNPDIQQKAEFSCTKTDGSLIYLESFFSNHLENSLITGIVINSRDISERKISALKEKEYQENLVFLENTALEFLTILSSEQIFNYIGQKIYELVPESVVIFSSYDETENSFVIQNITGVEKFLGIIVDFLGESPLHYRAKLSAQMKRELISTANKLHELNGGIYNVCNRQIDFMVCKALEKLISLNKTYGMGIVRDGKLLGSIAVLTRYSHFIKDNRIVETFMYQASIALLRRNLEKELVAAKEKAEESDKLKTAFLANMSHEIRTPVNGIIGFSQLLEDKNITDEKQSEYIEIIRANADSLISLIDDILDVSIIQEGQVKLRKTTVNINLLLDEVFSNFLSPRYQEKGLELEIKKGLSDESAILITDPLRLKQILNNLISNAFKFTEKGKIEFGYTAEPNLIKFYVKDTGIGISQEKQDAIFMRFIQGDSSFTRRFGGSGLGLAISKGLVELLGGNISVTSKPGEGSEFYFTLPNANNNWKSPENLVESSKTNPSLLN